MLGPLRPRSVYDVMAAIACAGVLAGGTAYATHVVVDDSDVVDESLTGADVKGKAGAKDVAAVNGSLTGDDISGQPANRSLGQPAVAGSLTTHDLKDGNVFGADLAANAVNGAKVANDTLTGADVAESTLGTVPGADRLDGYDANALSRTAQGVGSTAFGIGGPSLRPLAGATLNVPAAGFVKVTANAVAEDLFGSSPCVQCFVEILVRDEATGDRSRGSAGVLGANANAQTQADLQPLALVWTFPASPGARTYTLLAREIGGDGQPVVVGYANAVVQAEFIPFGSTGSPTVLGSASARSARTGARRTERRGDLWMRRGR